MTVRERVLEAASAAGRASVRLPELALLPALA